VTEPAFRSSIESAKLEWSGECCIESLSERREELLRALEDGLPVTIDLSGVSRIDTAGLQLLVSFVLNMRREDRVVTLAAVSAPVVEGARLAGLTALLELQTGSTDAPQSLA
jgi:anti-anti-sigma factor